MRLRVVTLLVALILVGACDASTGEVRPPTATSSDSTTSAETPSAVSENIVSPSWVPEGYENPGELIELALAGEKVEVSELMERVVLENRVVEGAEPYLYRASLLDGQVTHENLSVRLGNQDSLSVGWHDLANYRSCAVCVANQVPWDNGWLVWTDAEPARGMLIYRAEHAEIPLAAEIWFFPDPIEWPEAAAETNPILRTSADEAEAIATAILNALEREVPVTES